MAKRKGLQRAAARVVELRAEPVVAAVEWAAALDDLAAAVKEERYQAALRVARMRERRREAQAHGR